MGLTGDGHVHTEWSWDVSGSSPSDAAGRMTSMCRRAMQIGLPALAFTEHLDVTSWAVAPEDLPERLRPLIGANGVFAPPVLDAEGYLDSVERCRDEFPDLQILTGVELGQPHLEEARARQVIDLDSLDRVNGSLHTVPTTDEPGSVRSEPYTLYRLWPADDVVRSYLAEMVRMIAAGGTFAVVSHIEYAVRYWPTDRAGGAVRPEAVRGRVPSSAAHDRPQRPGARAQHRRVDPTVDSPVVAGGGRPGDHDRQRRSHP